MEGETIPRRNNLVLFLAVIFSIIVNLGAFQPSNSASEEQLSPSSGYKNSAFYDFAEQNKFAKKGEASNFLRNLPPVFMPNMGQIDPSVYFYTKKGASSYFFLADGIVWDFQNGQGKQNSSSYLLMNFHGSRLVQPVGKEKAGYSVNIFGSGLFQRAFSPFQKVDYPSLYPGVDLVCKTENVEIAISFESESIHALERVSFSFQDSIELSLDRNGDLLISASSGRFLWRRPYLSNGPRPIFMIEGNIVRVQLPSTEMGRQTLRFAPIVSMFPDRSAQAVRAPRSKEDYSAPISPFFSQSLRLVYSTLMGGNDYDQVEDIAVDSSGCVYIVGETLSVNFPLKNPYRNDYTGGAWDGFIVKLSASGDSLVYSTYFGGGGIDFIRGIAIDSDNAIFITGSTQSSDFPIKNAFQPTINSHDDAFVAKIDASGSNLVYSTFLGGNYFDYGFDITLDSSHCAYITGDTWSSDFPVKNPYLKTFQGWSDAFVAKFNEFGDLVYSTYLGGSSQEQGRSLTVDSNGNAFITGWTSSDDFPTKEPFQKAIKGANDVFVSKLDSAGNILLYSTYLGGNVNEMGHGIAVDALGCAYIIGDTDSDNFPTKNAFQNSYKGGADAFFTKLNASGTGLVYSSYLGGTNADRGYGIHVDLSGYVYITGVTTSTDFPTLNPVYSSKQGKSDAFICCLKPPDYVFFYSTFLGGSNDDFGQAITVDSLGYAYIAGSSKSNDFPTQNAFQDKNNGSNDIFVAKLSSIQEFLATVQFSSSTIACPEDSGTAKAIVTLSSPSATQVTVYYFTQDGTATSGNDYTCVSETLTFMAGETSKEISIPIIDDSVFEGSDETFTVKLTNSTNAWIGNPSTAIVTIRDNDPTFTIDLSHAAAIFVDNNRKLRKASIAGIVTPVISTDPNVGQMQFDPNGNLFIVFEEKQSIRALENKEGVLSQGLELYIMAKYFPKENKIVGIDKGLSSLVWKADSVSPNIQFDASGTIYYLAQKDDGKIVLRRYVNDADMVDFINENIEVFHWLVLPDGPVVIGGKTIATQITWLRKYSPAGELMNLASPAQVGWILYFPDTYVYAGLPRTDPYYGVYKLSHDLSYINNKAAASPFIGFKSLGYTASYDVDELAAELDPTYCKGFTDTAGTKILGVARTKDGNMVTLVGEGNYRTVVSLYPTPNVMDLRLIDRISLLKESLGQLVLPGTKNGINKLIVYDMKTKKETNILFENIEIYHLDILSTGSILFDGLKFDGNKNIIGMFERAAGTTSNTEHMEPDSISGYTLRELATLSGKPINFLVLGPGTQIGTPVLRLSKTALSFGGAGTNVTSAQSVVVDNSGTGTLNWTAAADKSWIILDRVTGSGTGTISVSCDPSGLSPGTYAGTISITDPNATNSPQIISVNLKVFGAGSTTPPFGDFATPINGTTGITGAIPVTGWVLDDIETTKVEIWRDPTVGEGTGIVFIGNGLFGYPGYPFNYRAGWGYMLLTNFLPGQGNGTYKLHAFATDKEGNAVLLGTKTITCDNSHAVKPFGTIDTPPQGGDTSGSAFVNFGWVLTPQTKTVPKDGSTIDAYVDSIKVGNLATAPNVYNQYRIDVATAFPGLNNSGGPVGAFYLDTTKLPNGVHTIFWIATDDAGAADGIGSRYFNVVNTGGTAEILGYTYPRETDIDRAQQTGYTDRRDLNIDFARRYVYPNDLLNLPLSFVPLTIKRGFDLYAPPETITPDYQGYYRLEAREVELVQIFLEPNQAAQSGFAERDDPPTPSFRKGGELKTYAKGEGEDGRPTVSNKMEENVRYSGYQIVGDQLRPLPIGSNLDPLTGRFSWLPGPGFLGTYGLLFFQTDGFGIMKRISVKLTIKPKFDRN